MSLISREEAMEILTIARAQGDYSLGSVVPRAMTTIIVLYAQLDGREPLPERRTNDGRSNRFDASEAATP